MMKFMEEEKMRERAKAALRTVLGEVDENTIAVAADRLIREGALFPPVKLGDKMYAAFAGEGENGEDLIEDWTVHGFFVDRNGNMLILDVNGDESRLGEWDCLPTREAALAFLEEEKGREA